MDNELIAPFTRLLEEISPLERVRQFENGTAHQSVWNDILASGFLDALVPEERDGFGLTPTHMAPLLIACGRHLLPAPFGDTLVARALAPEGLPVETGILLWPTGPSGRLRSLVPPVAQGATHALVQQGENIELRALVPQDVPHSKADGFGFMEAALDETVDPLLEFKLPQDTLFNWAAVITAASMAGAMAHMLDMTVTYVNERQQFGRALAKFQAIQQQISVFAERVAIANVAASLGLSEAMPGPTAVKAAIAKTIANESATIAANVAHAAHGAIGITWEHNLSLFVRRLRRWQMAYGSGDTLSAQVGRERLAHAGPTSVDFLRKHASF